ncbi:DUF4238 domain-containing protein [Pectobacterium aroidearum]|uniref:DUF4238 domain-containing protein n=1 Tax=Pectobacterium aroidearum TaxID=1201031 RepID=UPI0032EF827E
MEFVDIKRKKRQHYVPQFYLKYWMSRDGIWVRNNISGNPKTYPKKMTEDIAEEKYFYGIKMDDVVWDLLIYKYKDEIDSDQLLKLLFNEFRMLRYADDVVNKGWLVVNHDKELMEYAKRNLDIYNKIFIENKYASLENIIAEMINEIVLTQESVILTSLNKEMYINILAFFSFQLFRTKKMMFNLNESIKQMILTRDKEEIILTQEQKDSYLKCMLYIESYKFLLELEKKCFTIRIFKNHTKINYISSDSPAMFFQDKFFGVMPLSPRLLVQIDIENNIYGHYFDKRKVELIGVYDSEKVKISNKLIQTHSHNFLFAKKKLDLKFDD